ncbi:Retrotransposon gag protein [Gossypium australe]|uniref:Retrotransposon gag protein n=1 Tax=Gossypium australe TaxID=47621 RepID=A0A5B6US10_9ROSI|nr:Retrotransposon gag protein [Gossypium australe]
MTKKFLLKYFPPVKTTKLSNDIFSFVQFDIETLYDTWERFKDLLRKFPHHGLHLWLQIIDAPVGRTLNNKTLETTLNNYRWQVMRTKPTKATGVFNIDAVAMLAS